MKAELSGYWQGTYRQYPLKDNTISLKSFPCSSPSFLDTMEDPAKPSSPKHFRPWQRPDKRLKKSRDRSLLSDTWLPECAALLLSTTALLLQVILLFRYHDQAPFRWNGLTLNTWVSILSMTTKTSLLFAISSALGQWKYIFYSHRDRPVIGFDILDCASRGPYGSLQFLVHSRLRYALAHSIT